MSARTLIDASASSNFSDPYLQRREHRRIRRRDRRRRGRCNARRQSRRNRLLRNVVRNASNSSLGLYSSYYRLTAPSVGRLPSNVIRYRVLPSWNDRGASALRAHFRLASVKNRARRRDFVRRLTREQEDYLLSLDPASRNRVLDSCPLPPVRGDRPRVVIQNGDDGYDSDSSIECLILDEVDGDHDENGEERFGLPAISVPGPSGIQPGNATWWRKYRAARDRWNRVKNLTARERLRLVWLAQREKLAQKGVRYGVQEDDPSSSEEDS